MKRGSDGHSSSPPHRARRAPVRGPRARAVLGAATLALGVATTSGAAAQDGFVRYALDGERGLLARSELSEFSERAPCPPWTVRAMSGWLAVRVTTQRGPIRVFELCVRHIGGAWNDFSGGVLVPERRGRGRLARGGIILAGHDVRLDLPPERMRLTRVQMGSGRIDGRIVGAVLRTPEGVRHRFDAEFSFTLRRRYER